MKIFIGALVVVVAIGLAFLFDFVWWKIDQKRMDSYEPAPLQPETTPPPEREPDWEKHEWNP